MNRQDFRQTTFSVAYLKDLLYAPQTAEKLCQILSNVFGTLPSSGTIAGQAVASAVDELLGLTDENALQYNDLDIFQTATYHNGFALKRVQHYHLLSLRDTLFVAIKRKDNPEGILSQWVGFVNQLYATEPLRLKEVQAFLQFCESVPADYDRSHIDELHYRYWSIMTPTDSHKLDIINAWLSTLYEQHINSQTRFERVCRRGRLSQTHSQCSAYNEFSLEGFDQGYLMENNDTDRSESEATCPPFDTLSFSNQPVSISYQILEITQQQLQQTIQLSPLFWVRHRAGANFSTRNSVLNTNLTDNQLRCFRVPPEHLLRAQLLVESFDINAVQVGIHLPSMKLVFSEAYLQYLNNRQLGIVQFKTPSHSLIRVHQKAAVLPAYMNAAIEAEKIRLATTHQLLQLDHDSNSLSSRHASLQQGDTSLLDNMLKLPTPARFLLPKKAIAKWADMTQLHEMFQFIPVLRHVQGKEIHTGYLVPNNIPTVCQTFIPSAKLLLPKFVSLHAEYGKLAPKWQKRLETYNSLQDAASDPNELGFYLEQVNSQLEQGITSRKLSTHYSQILDIPELLQAYRRLFQNSNGQRTIFTFSKEEHHILPRMAKRADHQYNQAATLLRSIAASQQKTEEQIESLIHEYDSRCKAPLLGLSLQVSQQIIKTALESQITQGIQESFAHDTTTRDSLLDYYKSSFIFHFITDKVIDEGCVSPRLPELSSMDHAILLLQQLQASVKHESFKATAYNVMQLHLKRHLHVTDTTAFDIEDLLATIQTQIHKWLHMAMNTSRDRAEWYLSLIDLVYSALLHIRGLKLVNETQTTTLPLNSIQTTLLQKYPEYKSVKIQELTRSWQLHMEGKEMRHCVGSYTDKVQAGTSKVLSIQTVDANSNRLLRATLEVLVSNNNPKYTIGDFRCKANIKPEGPLLQLGFDIVQLLTEETQHPH